MALAVVVALSAILGTLAMQIFPELAEGGLGIPVLSPLARVALQTGGMVLTAWLIATVGRAFGGQGDFPDALLIVIWLEFLLLVAQAALSFELWFGVMPDLATAHARARSLLEATQ